MGTHLYRHFLSNDQLQETASIFTHCFNNLISPIESPKGCRKISVEYRSSFYILILGLFLSLFAQTSALADSRYRSKLSLDVAGFKANPENSIGWLTGLRWGQFLGDSQVYWGLGAFFGSPTGKAISEEYLTFGGLQLGWELAASKKSFFEFDILLGYGQGEFKNLGVKQNSYYVVQPGAAFGFRLGQGWKALFTAHYLHMSDARDFSGPSIGIRLEFKSLRTTKFVND